MRSMSDGDQHVADVTWDLRRSAVSGACAEEACTSPDWQDRVWSACDVCRPPSVPHAPVCTKTAGLLRAAQHTPRGGHWPLQQ